MSDRPAEPREPHLPASLPIFPLSGVLLLPRGHLPLNIFEPRYLNMTNDAIASDRMIGMIQPDASNPHGMTPSVFKTGCAGRITAFAEEGGRYLITLTGICRFDIASEVATTRLYRRVVPDWTPYQADLHEQEGAAIDRKRLTAGLKAYFQHHGINADWTAIEASSDERLVTSLAMVCPFTTVDKQSLLEAAGLIERSKLLIGLVETAILGAPDAGSRPN